MEKLNKFLVDIATVILVVVIFAIPVYIGINYVFVNLVSINEISFYQSCILVYVIKMMQLLVSAPFGKSQDN
jgi:hypothetical protein